MVQFGPRLNGGTTPTRGRSQVTTVDVKDTTARTGTDGVKRGMAEMLK